MKKHNIKKLTVIILLLFCNLKINAQDIIVKTDGAEIQAKVTEINSSEVKFKRLDNIDGPLYTLSQSEITSIKYPNGKIETFTKIVKPKNPGTDSIVKGYYNTGELKSEIPYVNGKMNGIQKMYWQNGRVMALTPWVNGTINGLQKSYYEDGKLCAEMNYSEGKKNGITKIYRKSGRVITETNYNDDKKDGLEVTYNENGTELLRKENKRENEIIEGDKQDGVTKTFYENSQLKSETPRKDGKIDGLCRTYWENGKTKREIPYTDGKKNGIEKYYLNSGQMIYELPYVNDKQEGVDKVYNEEGKLLSEINVDENKGITRTRSYNEEGNIIIAVRMVNLVPDGESFSYYKSGQIFNECVFVNGKIKGTPKIYKEKSKYMSETDRKEYKEKKQIQRSEDLKSLAGVMVEGTQQFEAGQNFQHNPNSETLNNYVNVIDNNNTKAPEEAIKANDQILEGSAHTSANHIKSSQVNSESLAVTNGGNNSNQNAEAAKKCADDTKSRWESQQEYNNFKNNPGCSKMALIAQKRLAEMLLQSCREYLPSSEVDGFNKTIASLTSQINSTPDCKTY